MMIRTPGNRGLHKAFGKAKRDYSKAITQLFIELSISLWRSYSSTLHRTSPKAHSETMPLFGIISLFESATASGEAMI